MRYYEREELEALGREMAASDEAFPEFRFLPGWGTPIVKNGTEGRGTAFTAAVLNVAYGRPVEPLLRFLRAVPRLREADVLLLNEATYRRTPEEEGSSAFTVAQALGLNAAVGMEYLSAAEDGSNTGKQNAILSRFPLRDAVLFPIPAGTDRLQRSKGWEMGNRNALCARIDCGGTSVVLCCTHLENRTTPQGRREQLVGLLEELDRRYPGMPVLVGGDLNTNTLDGRDNETFLRLAREPEEQLRRIDQVEELEPLFAAARERGWSWRDCSVGPGIPTRRRPGRDGTVLHMKLDWFLQRGLRCGDTERVEAFLAGDAAASEGTPGAEEISDHDAVLVRCAL